MIGAQFEALRDVEAAIPSASADRKGLLLRHVTDLFVVGSDHYSDEQLALFDGVFNQLVAEIEISAKALLAIRLAPLPNAPPHIIRALACDDAIEVATPILSQSQSLDEPTLLETAKSKGQEHLFAIARRVSLSEIITDVLLKRGDRQVVLTTAENRGARFSAIGFDLLVQKSECDDRLAACVGARPDIPPQLFRKLLEKASEHVRAKLETQYPRDKKEVRRAVTDVANRVQALVFPRSTATDPDLARGASIQTSGPLSDQRLRAFADAGQIEEITNGIARMCQLPAPFVKNLVGDVRPDKMIVLAKAVGLSWATLKAILKLQAGGRVLSDEEIAQSLASFERIKREAAQEIVKFYRLRETGNR